MELSICTQQVIHREGTTKLHLWKIYSGMLKVNIL